MTLRAERVQLLTTTLLVLTGMGLSKKKSDRKTKSRNREGSEDDYGEQDSNEDSDVQDIDKQDADHAMVDEVHCKTNKMTMSDGDPGGSNDIFDEDSSNDGTKLGDKAIGGQHEEGGIKALNNLFDDDDMMMVPNLEQSNWGST